MTYVVFLAFHSKEARNGARTQANMTSAHCFVRVKHNKIWSYPTDNVELCFEVARLSSEPHVDVNRDLVLLLNDFYMIAHYRTN